MTHQLDLFSSPEVLRGGELVAIEGGRSIAARDVSAKFAEEYEDILGGVTDIAGFFIVAWDDEGNRTFSLHFGRRNPIAPPLIKKFISDAVQESLVAEPA